MINVFNEIVDHNNLDDFRPKLNRIGVLKIFHELYDEFEDEDDVRKIVQYIAYCYSMESPKISVGGDWKREKQLVYMQVELPAKDETFINNIIYLQSEKVREAILNWMKYKDSNQLTYLKTLQDLYIQMQKGAISDIMTKGNDSQINYDQKQRCAMHMKELRAMIRDAESSLEQNSDLLKPKIEEVNSHQKPKRETLGVEHFVS